MLCRERVAMRPPCWPDWLDGIWAKSPEKGAGGRGESLAEHTWLVLERLADFIRLRPALPQAVGVPRLWNILFWAAFLHDFGKAAAGFQARLRDEKKRWPHRHEVLSLAFIDWIADGLERDEQAWVVAAIVSHHKDAGEIAHLYPPPDDPDDDQLAEVVAELSPAVVRGLWRWLSECAEAWVTALGLAEAGIAMPAWPKADGAVAAVTGQGVQRIYHWLKVYRCFVGTLDADDRRPWVIGTLALRGYLVNADQSASAHAGRLPRASFTAEVVLQSRGIAPSVLFPHQAEAAGVAGSALLTAPTGSGKTEAALLWAARQGADSGLPRLFYTLPYQASMNAMLLRLRETFGEAQVGLQHGRSLLALYRQLLDRDYDPQQATREAKWARNLAQLNYPPVRIFSPYQMLKGIYRLKGYEALLSDYHGAAFIFDEIHAYEVTRLALILRTIAYLARNFDARFLVMSATFPSLIKGWLREALGAAAEIVAAPEVFAAFRRHRLRLLDGELTSEEGLARIISDARAGKSVLVACNLVDRAQGVYNRLSPTLAADGIAVELIHGRFNVRDRLAKEQLVCDAAGSTSQARRPIVLVATQVVEVSLDIDLDTIYSDPAPLEALVQRFGRVNRRRKQADLAPVYVFRQPDDGQKIYDPALVQATLRILVRESGRPVDESAIGGWLDKIYAGDIADRWREEFEHAAIEFEASCIRPLRAFHADRSLEELFYKAFDSIEVLPNDLYDEFMRLKEEEPIRAYELLVPISWGRYHALAGKGYLKRGDRDIPPVVLTGYSSELGLTFERRSEEK
ncbi:MAG: CRISPR-associated helicase Cas3' [Desulfosoma sp.]